MSEFPALEKQNGIMSTVGGNSQEKHLKTREMLQK